MLPPKILFSVPTVSPGPVLRRETRATTRPLVIKRPLFIIRPCIVCTTITTTPVISLSLSPPPHSPSPPLALPSRFYRT